MYFGPRDVEFFLVSIEAREATKQDYRKKLLQFYKTTKGELTPERVLEYVIDRSQTADPSRYFTVVKIFLKWLADFRGQDYSNLINLLNSHRKRKTKRLFAHENSLYDVTLEDVHDHILSLYKSNLRTVVKLRAITASTLAATTGLRPEELKRLEPSDLNLTQDYFILPAEKSKTWTERVIPLHPDVKKLLKLMFCNNSKLFTDGSIRHAFSKAGKLQLRQFRKFFAIYSAKVGLPEPVRVAIMGHDTEELEKLLNVLKTPVTDEFYRKFTPDAIVKEYMRTWGGVEIVPSSVQFS
ncbi:MULTISPECIES: site-specific integrase [unclassified Archaeoglobus]|jgi:integrase|uniref:site-specific integrase n=1 Tax=unclassified Archaeoglobus TaxID=2643606 RepID=UPI0025C1C98E|nr:MULTISPECIES: site-specific integrase [unclassified Archaeoglobus]